MLCSVTLVINDLSLHIQVLSTLSVWLFYSLYLVLVSHCHKFYSFTERFDTDTHTPSLFVFNIALAMYVGIALNLKIDLGKTHTLATSSLLFRSSRFSLHYIKSCKFFVFVQKPCISFLLIPRYLTFLKILQRIFVFFFFI